MLNEVLKLFKIVSFSRILMLNKNDMAICSFLGLLNRWEKFETDIFERRSLFPIFYFNIGLVHRTIKYFLNISANIDWFHEKDVFFKVDKTHFILVNHK